MATNLFKSSWAELQSGELLCILRERIGKPGQYRGRAKSPNTFYLPLADDSRQVTLTFSRAKKIIAIEPGPAFDSTTWAQIVNDIEASGPIKFGRDCSFASFRVNGSWRGQRSGVQILPTPVVVQRL